MKRKKVKPNNSGYIEYINPEYDEEYETSIEGDIPQLKNKTKTRPKKFKLNGDSEGNNLLNKKNNKSRKSC